MRVGQESGQSAQYRPLQLSRGNSQSFGPLVTAEFGQANVIAVTFSALLGVRGCESPPLPIEREPREEGWIDGVGFVAIAIEVGCQKTLDPTP